MISVPRQAIDQVCERRINLVQARANRYADTAALFQALGGGWRDRVDLPKNLTRHVQHPRYEQTNK